MVTSKKAKLHGGNSYKILREAGGKNRGGDPRLPEVHKSNTATSGYRKQPSHGQGPNNLAVSSALLESRGPLRTSSSHKHEHVQVVGRQHAEDVQKPVQAMERVICRQNSIQIRIS